LIDDGASVNVCPLRAIIKLNIDPKSIIPTITDIKAFDDTYHEVLSTIELLLQIGLI
jgi:hypothetical protein